MKSGLIIVYKEAGFTSFDVVAKLRGICKTKKIGHTGTLDPSATGVLPVVIGKATKAINYIEDHDKTYVAGVTFGRTTDTYDGDGKVLSSSDVTVTKEEFLECIKGFIGKQKQIPPMYSAKKINGKKLYELARAGIEVERKPENIEIFELSLLDFDYPNAKILVSCSKGTYIRSLIHDMGQALGCGAYMSSLERTKACGFCKEQSHTLEELQNLADAEKLEDAILPLDEMFFCPKCYCSAEANVFVENGNTVPYKYVTFDETDSAGGWYRTYHSDGRFAGLYKKEKDGLKLEKFFLE